MSGLRLVVGAIVMGIAVPIALFFLLELHSFSKLFAIAATTLIAWGVADLLSTILEKPRLRDRSPGKALKEDWERRSKE
ncbi:MAG TPA: hypothetical protein VNI54_11415 [Thermoanaerobaculia bacterium]|nr:hypothetical protein [Thermoanaerobaculia bacterium]